MSFLSEIVGGSVGPSSSGGSFLKSLTGSETAPTPIDPTPPENHNFFSNAFEGLKSGYQASADQAPAKSFNLRDAGEAGGNVVLNALNDFKAKSAASDQAMATHASALERGVTAGEAGLAALNVLFTPITATLAVMSKLPVVGLVADKINEVFSAVGQGASQATTKGLVDNLPISQKTKDTIDPLVGQISALAAQMALGKAGAEVIPALGDKVNALKDHLTTDLTRGGANPTPVETAPLVKDGFLAGVSKPDVSVAKTVSPEVTSTVEPSTPIKTENVPIVESKAPVEAPVAPREPGVAKSASDINQNLVKQGFDALPPEEQAKFDQGSYKETADKVASMMDSNIEDVKSMARGDIPVPNDVTHPQILFNAVEALASKEGDVQLLKDLANSPLASKTSEAGATLGSHGFNDNPNSAVDQIKSVQKAREDFNIKKKGQPQFRVTEQDKTSLQDEVQKASKVTPKTWNDFIEQLKCQY